MRRHTVIDHQTEDDFCHYVDLDDIDDAGDVVIITIHNDDQFDIDGVIIMIPTHSNDQYDIDDANDVIMMIPTHHPPCPQVLPWNVVEHKSVLHLAVWASKIRVVWMWGWLWSMIIILMITNDHKPFGGYDGDLAVTMIII